MIKEFKEFAMRGNVLDMAVGLILGVSFGSVVSSLVDDVIMPPVGLLLGNVDFSNLFIILREGDVAGPYLSVAEAQLAGAVKLNYGLFINNIINIFNKFNVSSVEDGSRILDGEIEEFQGILMLRKETKDNIIYISDPKTVHSAEFKMNQSMWQSFT